MTNPCLEVHNLSHRTRQNTGLHRLRRREILHELSFAIGANHVVGLVGEIGAGKTTLLHCLAGLRPVTQGEVTLDGAPLRRGDVALVDQRASLPSRLSIAELGELGRGYNTTFDYAFYEGLIDAFDLPRDSTIKRASEGQRKVTAIAAALARHTRLLLLDEPLAALDPMSRRQIMGEVLAQAAEHQTMVIISSHLVVDIERDCDWLLILDGGRLIVSEAIDDLVGRHAYVVGPPPTGSTLVTGGTTRSMVRFDAPADSADEHPGLEEIVIGYLQTGRSLRSHDKQATQLPLGNKEVSHKGVQP
jgi:ABC-2 type transport system ATP-binding protein